MTAEIVGPLPAVHFYDGSAVAYTPPRNTLDPRFAACREHRVACDCREAEQAEERAEARAYRVKLEAAFVEVLGSHPTWLFDEVGFRLPGCQCSGCRIARITFVAYLRLVKHVGDTS